VEVVDKVVDPGAAYVLVETHRPTGHGLPLGIAQEPGNLADRVGRDAGEFFSIFRCVGVQECFVLLKTYRLSLVGKRFVRFPTGFRSAAILKVVLYAIADPCQPLFEGDMLLNKCLAYEPFFHDDMRHGIREGEVCVRLENSHDICGLIAAAVQKGLQADDLDVGILVLPLHHPRVEDRMRLSKVRAPNKKGIGEFNIVVTPHRLIHAKGREETGHGRGHAEARIALDVVGANPRLHQFIDGVAFKDRCLT